MKSWKQMQSYLNLQSPKVLPLEGQQKQVTYKVADSVTLTDTHTSDKTIPHFQLTVDQQTWQTEADRHEAQIPPSTFVAFEESHSFLEYQQ